VAFSPDGHRLASASADQLVRVWNADTGQPISDPFTRHTNYVSGVAFSPDGRRAVSSGWDHTLRLWPMEAAPKTLCDKLATNVSHKDWRLALGGFVRSYVGHGSLSAAYPIAPRPKA
jgi:WD40 repeat protein